MTTGKLAADSPRWCEICNNWGDHHTDRHPAKTGETAKLTVEITLSTKKAAELPDDLDLESAINFALTHNSRVSGADFGDFETREGVQVLDVRVTGRTGDLS